jgi:hypothetical protein
VAPLQLAQIYELDDRSLALTPPSLPEPFDLMNLLEYASLQRSDLTMNKSQVVLVDRVQVQYQSSSNEQVHPNQRM